jgi:hypothetical protein
MIYRNLELRMLRAVSRHEDYYLMINNVKMWPLHTASEIIWF